MTIRYDVTLDKRAFIALLNDDFRLPGRAVAVMLDEDIEEQGEDIIVITFEVAQ